ncbi:MAG: arginine repressor [Bacillota bacterium]|nr:arginine repressor [Bacillota bacterium]
MKATRHAKILELISKTNVETQDELAQLLRDSGFDVTQATVSRDIKELRLNKVLSEKGVYRYTSTERNETASVNLLVRMFAESVVSIDCAGNLIVIKTISGSANIAAEAIDSMKWPEIAGTLAGDNTIFVALRDNEACEKIMTKFKNLVQR